MALFRLPLPPSTNDLLRPIILGYVHGKPQLRMVATTEAKQFRAAAHRCLPVVPVEGPVEVFATFYMPSISSDCANRLKALEDACNGRLFWDDSQVAEVHLRKCLADEKHETGVVFEVKLANPAEHYELARRLAKSATQRRANEARQVALGLEPEEPEDAPSPLPSIDEAPF